MFEPSSSTYSDSPGNDDQINRNEDPGSDLDNDSDSGSEEENDPLDSDTARAERKRDEGPRDQSGMPGYFSPEPYRWPPLHIYYMSLKADIVTLLQHATLHVLSPG